MNLMSDFRSRIKACMCCGISKNLRTVSFTRDHTLSLSSLLSSCLPLPLGFCWTILSYSDPALLSMCKSVCHVTAQGVFKEVMLIFIFLLHHDPMCYFYFPPKPPNSRYTLGIHASLFAWSPPVQDMLLPLWPYWGPVRAPQPDSPQLLHTLQTIQLQTAESVSQFSMS